jgi:hypothetical protein
MQAIHPDQMSDTERRRVFYTVNIRLAVARGDEAKAEMYRNLLATLKTEGR